jgi:two-component system, cell cycle sensor histidine kinase and response regulator CckA
MNTKSIKVLLVEDDQDDYVIVLDYFCRMKEGQFELDWICSYEDAQREVAKHRHDLYIFDYRLGPEDGLNLLREAKAGGCTAPIIILTRYHDPNMEKEAYEAGAADCLNKSKTSAMSLEQALFNALASTSTPAA